MSGQLAIRILTLAFGVAGEVILGCVAGTGEKSGLSLGYSEGYKIQNGPIFGKAQGPFEGAMHLNTVALFIWAAVLLVQCGLFIGESFIVGGSKSQSDTYRSRLRPNKDKHVSPWSFGIFFSGLATIFLVAFDHIWLIKKASLRADDTALTPLGLAFVTTLPWFYGVWFLGTVFIAFAPLKFVRTK